MAPASSPVGSSPAGEIVYLLAFTSDSAFRSMQGISISSTKAQKALFSIWYSLCAYVFSCLSSASAPSQPLSMRWIWLKGWISFFFNPECSARWYAIPKSSCPDSFKRWVFRFSLWLVTQCLLSLFHNLRQSLYALWNAGLRPPVVVHKLRARLRSKGS